MDEKEIKERYKVERRIREIEKYNHNIREEYNAFKSKKDALFYICIIKTNAPQRPKDPIEIKIFVFENQNSHLHVLEKEDAKQVENGWKDLLEKLLKNKNIGEIRKCGDFFYEKLFGNKLILPSILSNERNGMGGIWISCAVAIIDPIWEWLCPKCSNGEGFFWGDNFSIVRLPEDCKFEEYDLQLTNTTILKDEGCYARNDLSCLNKLSGAVTPLKLYDLEDPMTLNSFDSIHVAANRKPFEKHIKNAIETALAIETSLFSSKFLFLNICKSDEDSNTQELYKEYLSAQDILLKLKKLNVATAWIHTGFDVPDSFAHLFAKCFYDEFRNMKKNVPEAVKNAREKIKSLPGVDERNSFWRLAYVANGNPCAKFSWI